MKKFVALVMLNTLLLTISAWKCVGNDPLRFHTPDAEYSINQVLDAMDL